MLSDKITELVVGITTIIGAAILGILKKYNLIHFGRLQSETKKEEDIVKTVKCEECPAHPNIVKNFSEMHDQQLKNIELHRKHLENFKEGKKEFKEIKDELKTLGSAVAVLLDRTGGRPKGIYDKE